MAKFDPDSYCQKNLTWVVEDALCGSSCPGNGSVFQLKEDLAYLRTLGIFSFFVISLANRKASQELSH
jgi:hypothetical protein